MSDPSLAVQGALVARLKALDTSAGPRVFDRIEKGRAFPYITVGPGQTIPIDETCSDGSELYVQVDVWSRAVGFPEAKSIAGDIRVALHDQDLIIPEHVCDRMEVRSIDFTRDPDGLTNRARIELLITTQPA